MKNAATGFSNNSETVSAVQEALSIALRQSSGPFECALLFAGPQHDAAVVLREVRAAIGDTLIFGGSSTGVMTNDQLSYGGYEVGIALIPKGRFTASVLTAGPITNDEKNAGTSVG